MTLSPEVQKKRKLTYRDKRLVSLCLVIGSIFTGFMSYGDVLHYLPLSPTSDSLYEFDATIANVPTEQENSSVYKIAIDIEKPAGAIERAELYTHASDGYLDQFYSGMNIVVHTSPGHTLNPSTKIWQIMSTDEQVIVPFGYVKKFSLLGFIMDSVFTAFCLVVAFIGLWFTFFYNRKIKRSEASD